MAPRRSRRRGARAIDEEAPAAQGRRHHPWPVGGSCDSGLIALLGICKAVRSQDRIFGNRPPGRRARGRGYSAPGRPFGYEARTSWFRRCSVRLMRVVRRREARRVAVAGRPGSPSRVFDPKQHGLGGRPPGRQPRLGSPIRGRLPRRHCRPFRSVLSRRLQASLHGREVRIHTRHALSNGEKISLAASGLIAVAAVCATGEPRERRGPSQCGRCGAGRQSF